MRAARPARAVNTLVVVAATAPFATLVLQAFADRLHGRSVVPQELGTRGVRALWDDPILVDAIMGSLVVGVAVALVAVAVAWPAARYLATTRSRVGWVVLAAPVLLPPLVLGDGLAPWLLEVGLGGRTAIAVAHLPIAIPYAALALAPGFGADLDELDHTAAMLGATPSERLRHVVVPAARAHVLLALALAFTVSWSQYAISLTVGGGTPMLPLVLVPYVRSDPQIAAALALVFLVPPAVALMSASGAAGHRRAHRRVRTAEPTMATPTTTNDPTKATLVG